MKVWVAKICYHYGNENYQNELESDVKIFKDEKSALDYLNKVIREDWTTTVPIGDDEILLADHRGHCSNEGFPRTSEWNYSEDGRTAWAYFNDGHGYKGEVVEMEIEP